MDLQFDGLNPWVVLTGSRAPGPADTASLILIAGFVLLSLSRTHLWARSDPYKHLFFEKPQLHKGSSAQRQARTRDITRKLQDANKQVVVFYGSQSGTAEGLAKRLAHDLEIRFHGLGAFSADLSDYDAKSIESLNSESFVVFVLSTFGEGDPPDNATGFWKWVQTIQQERLRLRYCVFGLGNSNYKFFNNVAQLSDRLLYEASGHRLLPLRLADEAKETTEEDFLAWKDDLIAFFEHREKFVRKEITYRPALEVVWKETNSISIDVRKDLEYRHPKCQGTTGICIIPVHSCRELFSANAKRNCIHMEFNLSRTPEMVYKTGDHLCIWPENPEDEVEKLIRMAGLNEKADMPMIVRSCKGGVNAENAWPSVTTLRRLFRHHLAITAPVSRELVGLLACYAPSAESESLLTSLSRSPEAFNHFKKVHATHLGRILELALHKGPSKESWVRLPLSLVLENLTQMRPRRYSISSSSLVAPRVLSITVVVDAATLSQSRERVFGVASNYILNHQSNCQGRKHPHNLTYLRGSPTILAQIHRTRFKLPTLASTPLLLVASGTGIAPFRAFLQERSRLKQLGRSVGKVLLFYGCRRFDEDHIYATEFETYLHLLNNGCANENFQIITAYSRADAPTERRYVQDRIHEHGEAVVQLLVEAKANMYLCGMSAMARSVAAAVEAVLMQHRSWSETKARTWCEEKKRARKWLEDVWR